MILDDSILDTPERLSLRLRALYAGAGLTRFRMMKFEEYDLYSRNKAFLPSDRIITFTDTSGELMALKPDVTLSIVKSTRQGEAQRLYYAESVYRVSPDAGAFREIHQVGVELIGRAETAFCVSLAAESLKLVAKPHLLSLSHMALVNAAAHGEREIIRRMGRRSLHELNDAPDAAELIALAGNIAEVLPRLEPLAARLGQESAYAELTEVARLVPEAALDFSDVSDTGYYDGLLMKGFVEGVPQAVLAGGSYGGLMRRMGRTDSAVGFAVYLDRLERLEEVAVC